MRNDFQKQIDALWAAVRKLEQATAALAARAATAPSADVSRIEMAAAAAEDPVPPLPSSAQESTEISPETRAVIAATLSAFLGHPVRIRSVKMLEKPDEATTWVTYGRIAIQSSHNPRAVQH